MKILAIRGKNIASLEGLFEIDFTREPLASAGIFAITGSTGSGKSTLLDALCLALFGNTPRMSAAAENNVVIAYTNSKPISQQDCRTLLRRGTADGYAEADFLSLDGMRYRSTWSVRRARGKADGALMNREMRLLNLTTGEEVQGRAGELLQKVSELIGLTFGQFTRAVLLAQGDFATFLKAKQSDKAELLEKLTGTEVYSRISVLIHQKTKDAELEFIRVQERIQGVEVLSDEQRDAFRQDCDRLSDESRQAKEAALIAEAKLKWLDARKALLKNIEIAGQQCDEVCRQTDEAAPRFALIRRIESVQHLRDSFNAIRSLSQQLEACHVDLITAEKEYAKQILKLNEAKDACAAYEKEQRQAEAEWERIEPSLRQAEALDIRIANAEANLKDAGSESKKAMAEKVRLEKSVGSLTKEIEEARTVIAKAEAELDSCRPFEPLIPLADLILTTLADLDSATRKRLDSARKLETAKADLALATERLNLLSSGMVISPEIMSLRAELADGDPCPLCGSLHHPAKHISPEQVMESERIKKERLSLTAAIESGKTAVASLTASVENYSTLCAELWEKAEGLLNPLPQWKAAVEQGSLSAALKAAAAKWDASSRRKAAAASIPERNTPLLQNVRESLAAAISLLNEKQQKEAELISGRNTLSAQRKELLQGMTVEEINTAYSAKRKEAEQKIKKAAEAGNAIASKADILRGSIEQLKQNIAAHQLSLADEEAAVNRRLEQRADGLSRDEMQELLSKPQAWIQQEKALLADMEKRKTIARTALDERKLILSQHEQDAVKPSDDESRDGLADYLSNINASLDAARNRIAELEAMLRQDTTARERIASFADELEAKSALHENWRKLNSLLGSANGSKFKEIAQGYALDALLAYANKHLKELNRRYVLQRIPGTLALQVIDLEMLGEVRTVHSLSGGESFLLALALALGLSSLSSKRMKIESLFIDEGFGSLDADSLRIALHALENLQTQGRKIGVISHVAEMTGSIAVQIHVRRVANGRSVVE
ncbi:MAG: AAA family ATPase [Tannerellaceae bacterium]|jgi:exonuclease SbcC|nr:AAA family ATPase [Tannerellaceae bacterium]